MSCFYSLTIFELLTVDVVLVVAVVVAVVVVLFCFFLNTHFGIDV